MNDLEKRVAQICLYRKAKPASASTPVPPIVQPLPPPPPPCLQTQPLLQGPKGGNASDGNEKNDKHPSQNLILSKTTNIPAKSNTTKSSKSPDPNERSARAVPSSRREAVSKKMGKTGDLNGSNIFDWMAVPTKDIAPKPTFHRKRKSTSVVAPAATPARGSQNDETVEPPTHEISAPLQSRRQSHIQPADTMEISDEINDDVQQNNLFAMWSSAVDPKVKLMQLFNKVNVEFDVDVEVDLGDVVENDEIRSIKSDHIEFLKKCYHEKGIDYVLYFSFLILMKSDRESDDGIYQTLDGQHRIHSLKDYLLSNSSVEHSTTIKADFVCYGNISKQLKILITSFAEQSVGVFKREYNEEEVIKNGRLIVKYFPEMLQMDISTEDYANTSIKDIEAKEKINDTSINHQLCRILNVKNPKFFKKSMWRTSWFSDEHFDAIFEGLMQTTTDNRYLKEICSKYKTCQKRMLYILTNPVIYTDKEKFRQALTESTFHEYACWLKNINVWNVEKSETWHLKKIMGNYFDQFDEEVCEELVNDFITNYRNKKNFIDLSNMKKNHKSVTSRLGYLNDKFKNYMEHREKRSNEDASSAPSFSEISGPKPKRCKVITLRIPIDTLEAEYIQPLVKTEQSKAASLICNLVRRYATNKNNIGKDTLFSFPANDEYENGRFLLGTENKDNVRTRVFGPPVSQKEEYKSNKKITAPFVVTDYTPEIKKAVVKKGGVKKTTKTVQEEE